MTNTRSLDIIVNLIESIDDVLYESAATALSYRYGYYAKWGQTIYKQRGLPPSIKEMETMCEHMNNPYKDFDTIHVAGTNGKGSVCLKLAHICANINNHYPSVGLFVSPGFKGLRSRISIDGVMITKYDFYCGLNEILRLEQTLQIPLVFTEICTLMAFRYFSFKHVSIAVIETGLGGIYDASNVLKKPLCTIITSISMDHIGILGNTIKKITTQKCGIMKANVPCIIGPNVEYDIVNEYINNKESLKNVDIYQLKHADCHLTKTYDEINQLLVQLTMRTLNKYYAGKFNQDLLGNNKLQLLLQIRPPGRLEMHRISYSKFTNSIKHNARYKKYLVNVEDKDEDDILLMLDASHNPNGIKSFFRSIKNMYPPSKYSYSVVYGCKRKKQIEDCLKQIDGNANCIYFISAQSLGLYSMDILRQYEFSKTLVRPSCDEKDKTEEYMDIVLVKAISDCYRNNYLNDAAENKKIEIIFCIGTMKLHPQYRKLLGVEDTSDRICWLYSKSSIEKQ